MAKPTVQRGPINGSLRSQWLAGRRRMVGRFANISLTCDFSDRFGWGTAARSLCEIIKDPDTEQSQRLQFQQGRCAKSAQFTVERKIFRADERRF